MQVARLDELISRATDKVAETADFIQNSVLDPVRKARGIVEAISAGLSFLRNAQSRRRRPPSAEPEDEEMFI
jgi:hypothetical protein